MYKYDKQNMCDGSEYIQNILLNKSNNINISIILNHSMYFCHVKNI